MKIRVAKTDLLNFKSDLVVLFLFEEEKLPVSARLIDKKLNNVLGASLKAEFKGQAGSFLVVNTLGRLGAKRIGLVGLGKKEEFQPDKLRLAGATLVKAGLAAAASVVAGELPLRLKLSEKLNSQTITGLLTEGILLGGYEYKGYKSADEKNKKSIAEVVFIVASETQLQEARAGLNFAAVVGAAVNEARDIVNAPANRMNPADFVGLARRLFRGTAVRVSVYEKKQLERAGFGGLLAVAAGSAQNPKLLILEYRGGTTKNKLLGLVGKGITFDSGGISLKPAKGLAEMKDDLAGGAAVCLATKAVAALKLPVNLLTVIPLAENMPGAAALKPADVLRAFNGKTIEVVSTDAEGRLILADALSFAVKKGARYLVDVATLTGGCVIALGDLYTGAFSNNQELLDKVIAAGQSAGEKIWAFPDDKEYQEFLKSDLADLKNCPEDGKATTILGGIFLKEFVAEVPWVHLDIAGTSYLSREIDYLGKNATGVGVRTLVYLVRDNRF